MVSSSIKYNFLLSDVIYNDHLFEGHDLHGYILSDVVYCGQGHYDNIEIIDTISTFDGLQCMIVRTEYNNKELYSVVFRGTESACDWIHNLKTMKTKIGEGIYVHTGFLNQLKSGDSWERLKYAISKYSSKNTKWSITGHSLGGGIAVIACFLLSETFTHIKWDLVTFGCPRVGNKGFKDAINQNDRIAYYRIYDSLDPISYTPNYRYHHAGISVKFCSKKCKWEVADKNVKIIRPYWYQLKRNRHKCIHYQTIVGKPLL
jgi:hypothetical protein